MSWSIYLLRCGDGSLYTGIATDVDRRLEAHRQGTGAKYVRGRGPLELLFSRVVGDRGFALSAERRLKQLSPARKEALAADREAFDAWLEERFEEWADH